MLEKVEEKNFYSTGEAGKILSLHYTAIYDMIIAGKIKAIRVANGKWRIPHSEIMRILGDCK